MSRQNPQRYRSLPQHQLNELLSRRNEALHLTHSQPLQVFPRTNIKICQEIRGSSEWETILPYYDITPFDRPRSTHCQDIHPNELRYLEEKNKDTYLKHPKRVVGHTNKELYRRIIPPFLVTSEEPSNIGCTLWNHPTRLDE